jgi:hypothetical protein
MRERFSSSSMLKSMMLESLNVLDRGEMMIMK